MWAVFFGTFLPIVSPLAEYGAPPQGGVIPRMARLKAHNTGLIGALTVGSLILSVASHAGEPLTKMASSIVHAGGNAVHDGGNARAVTGSMRVPANRLDLAPPAIPLGAPEKADESFPTPNRHAQAVADTPARFGGVGNAIGNQGVPSHAEQLVRNFHRDGLPVAKLFQSENSLVHLGLNQKGKPGLWIVEKIH